MLEVNIDRESDTPLYIQIRDSIEEAINTGFLSPGDRLPSVSSLAKDVGVTQATIRRALKDLGNAGHTQCHVGRGTFIKDPNAPREENIPNTSGIGQDSSQIAAPNPLEFAARRLRMGVSKALCDIMSLSNKPGIIHLTQGVPDPDLLPDNFLEEVSHDTLQGGSKKLIAATESLGMYELREEIAKRFSQENTLVSPDQVLITNGSLQAITLVAEASLGKKRRVICETPCFKGITDTFAAMGHWVDTIPRDSEGPAAGQLSRFSDTSKYLLYVCPYSHNPMGTDLSPKRYNLLVEWAKKTGSVIITDEIFRDLKFQGITQPSLMKELGSEQTIVVSSLSKSIMTGLRVGWLISSARRVQELAQLKRLMDHSCPTFVQGMALSIFRSGKFDSHTKDMQVIYKKRMETMLNSLQKLMPKEVTWTKPDGGFSIYLQLPQGYSSVALFLSAIEKGVSFLPGPLFDIDQRFVHSFRLSVSWADENQIKEGIELLANAVEEFIKQPPGDTGLSGLGSYQ